MKDIESLKKEQAETKSKLVELVEFINSEEYYTLSPSEKNIIGQRRIALEMYLNSLTKGIYDKEGSTFDVSSAMWPLLMSSMFTGSSGFGPSSGLESLKRQLEEKDFEAKEESDESGCSNQSACTHHRCIKEAGDRCLEQDEIYPLGEELS